MFHIHVNKFVYGNNSTDLATIIMLAIEEICQTIPEIPQEVDRTRGIRKLRKDTAVRYFASFFSRSGNGML